MESVYIDTTIPSYYCAERDEPVVAARRIVTVSWWDGSRLFKETVSSAFMLEELSQGAYPTKGRCLELVRGIPLLPIPPDLEGVVGVYIENKLMPAEEAGDAAHLAMASLHKIDYLVTWNLRISPTSTRSGTCAC